MLSEQDESRAQGAHDKVAKAGFDIDGTPYADFIERYFGSAANP